MDLEVQRYLVECIESLRFLRSQYGAGHENVRESLASAGGVLSAFRVSKAVSDAEFDDWIWRAGEAAGLILPPRDAPRTGMHAAAFAEDPPKPGQPPVTRPPTPAPVQWDSYARFIRMLPGPDNELVIAGGHFRVLGLEFTTRGCGSTGASHRRMTSTSSTLRTPERMRATLSAYRTPSGT